MQIESNSEDSHSQSNSDQTVLKIIGQIDIYVSSQLNVRLMNRMNALLIYRNQEIARYNTLILLIQNNMADLQKAIKGQIIMSLELESVYYCFLENRIPGLWKSVSYLSIKPLG